MTIIGGLLRFVQVGTDQGPRRKIRTGRREPSQMHADILRLRSATGVFHASMEALEHQRLEDLSPLPARGIRQRRIFRRQVMTISG